MLLHTAPRIETSTPPENIAVGAMDRALPPPSRLKKYGPGIVIAAAITVLIVALFSRYGHVDMLAVAKDHLTIATVQEGGFQEFVPLSGTVAPINSVYVDIAEPGKVEEAFVETGNSVMAGQLLIRLSSTAPESELMASEMLLAQQVNQLSSTKLQYEQTRLNTERSVIDMHAALERLTTNHRRLLKLKETGAIRQADIDDEEIEIVRQRQTLAVMEKSLALSETQGKKQIVTMQLVIDNLTIRLKLARQRIDALQVKAPISGLLTNFDIHVGQRVTPAQRIGQVQQIDRNKIIAAVDEFYLNRVSLDQSATTLIDGESHLLVVTKVYPEVRNHVFNVDLTFKDTALPSIRLGQSVELRLNIGAGSQALFVANGPFYNTSSQSLFVLDRNGDAERRSITFGRHNIDQIEILAGLSAGDEVVISDYENFGGINRLRIY